MKRRLCSGLCGSITTRYRDIEFAQRLYRPLVVKCADFMSEFRDEKRDCRCRAGISGKTAKEFTLSPARRWSADFARRQNLRGFFARRTERAKYRVAADEIVEAMRNDTLRREAGRFVAVNAFQRRE